MKVCFFSRSENVMIICYLAPPQSAHDVMDWAVTDLGITQDEGLIFKSKRIDLEELAAWSKNVENAKKEMLVMFNVKTSRLLVGGLRILFPADSVASPAPLPPLASQAPLPPLAYHTVHFYSFVLEWASLTYLLFRTRLRTWLRFGIMRLILQCLSLTLSCQPSSSMPGIPWQRRGPSLCARAIRGYFRRYLPKLPCSKPIL